MNQCKRGSNVRLIKNDQVMTFENRMNEVELKRKAFQSVNSQERVEGLWTLVGCLSLLNDVSSSSDGDERDDAVIELGIKEGGSVCFCFVPLS